MSWYVCTCTLKQVIFCPFVFCRHRKETPKTTKQDGGYVMKRQRSFSNPVFMEQNKNALDYQLNSRNSMIPSVLRKTETNIDIPFEVYFTKQVNSKNSLNEQKINGSVSK